MTRNQLIDWIQFNADKGNPEFGVVLALLKAGCEFFMSTEENGDFRVIFDDIKGFGYFEGGDFSQRVIYLSIEKEYQIDTSIKSDYTKQELIAICEKAMVPMNVWRNRDSHGAVEQAGQLWGNLRAGQAFIVRPAIIDGDRSDLNTDEKTIWVECQGENYYLPTPARLKETEGKDWY